MPRPEARRAAPFATAGSPPACREQWHTCSLLKHGLANGHEALEVSVRICVDVLWPRRKCHRSRGLCTSSRQFGDSTLSCSRGCHISVAFVFIVLNSCCAQEHTLHSLLLQKRLHRRPSTQSTRAGVASRLHLPFQSQSLFFRRFGFRCTLTMKIGVQQARTARSPGRRRRPHRLDADAPRRDAAPTLRLQSKMCFSPRPGPGPRGAWCPGDGLRGVNRTCAKLLPPRSSSHYTQPG